MNILDYKNKRVHFIAIGGSSMSGLAMMLKNLGFDKLSGSDAYTIAVIGDGAFTGGMVHEALNNVEKDLRLIIVLNENEMSIAKNTGRFANTLAKIRRGHAYFKAKKVTRNFVKSIPSLSCSFPSS